MSHVARKALVGSARAAIAGARRIGAVDPQESIRVTVVLQRRSHELLRPRPRAPLARHEHAARFGADPAHLAAVEAFAQAHGLQVAASHADRRAVELVGTAQAMQQAFGTELHIYEAQGQRLRCRSGELSLPAEVHPHVMAVLGLDTRPVARSHRRVSPRATAASSFTPPQVAQLYSFPDGLDGSGQTIALIELGGGYQQSDLDSYFSGLGIATPTVVALGVDGGANTPGGDADSEVLLDIEIAGSVAPGARIAVYFGPNTDQGFLDAINQVAHDTSYKPGILSISWGGNESTWTAQARDAMNAALQDAAALGITVTVAAGDAGATDNSSDGSLQVDFPASSPWVLACGGTKLQAAGGAIVAETVWNELANNEGATGGGVSQVFPLPDYQQQAGVPAQPQTGFAGRGVPDVAGDADPVTGYQVLVDGASNIIGGTSAVAPLWAALVARLNQSLGKPLGFVNPLLYPLGESVFQDITVGGNGGYNAGPGWDPCTGLGSPKGAALLQLLSPQP